MDSILLVLLRLRSVLHSLYINLVYVHVCRFWIALVTLVWESRPRITIVYPLQIHGDGRGLAYRYCNDYTVRLGLHT